MSTLLSACSPNCKTNDYVKYDKNNIINNGKNKTIVVFGASGSSGRKIIDLAIEKQYKVIAAVRNKDSLKDYGDKIKVVKFDLSDYNSIKSAINGADIVVSALGTGGLSDAKLPTTLYSKSAEYIVKAMNDTGSKRLMFITSGGVDYDENAPWFYNAIIRRYIMNTYMDMMKAETIIELTANDLQWTIVRPTYLLNGLSNDFFAKDKVLGDGEYKIYRSDLARFIITEIQENKWIKRHPVLTY